MDVAARVDGSAQTRLVFQALRTNVEAWRYGYALVRETGLAPGTLYPILGRLTDRGLLESRWEDPPSGRPRRHLYRPTPEGVERAVQLAADPPRVVRPAASRRARWAEGST